MPPQALASATIERSKTAGLCPKCHMTSEIFCLTVTIRDHCGDWRHMSEMLCLSCLTAIGVPSLEIKVSDVVDIKTSKGSKRTINKIARKRERECAEDIGGRTTPASGAGIAKGDARNDCWMVDDKFTNSSAFQLTAQVMKKALSDARKTGRLPVLRVGLLKEKINMAVMMWDDFLEKIHAED